MKLENGIIFVILANIIWGISPLIIKLVPHTFPTSLLIATRFLIAGSILFIVIILNKKYLASFKTLTLKNILQIAVLGLIGTGLADLFFVHALRTIGVVLASILSRLELPLGVIMASIMLQEKISAKIIAATIISFLGVIFISFGDKFTLIRGDGFYVGILVALISAFLWAYSGIYGKKILSQKISYINVAFGRIFVGGTFNLIISLAIFKNIVPYYLTLQAADWLKIFYLAVVASALAFLLYYKGLQKIEAARASILVSLSLTISILSGVFLGESLTPLQWVGTGLILVGIFLTISQPRIEMADI